MALLREVVADLDTSFVPHDASRCAIFLTITMSCDKLVSHEIQHGNMPRPCLCPGPGPLATASYPGQLEESELYCKSEELGGGGLRRRKNRSIHDSRDEKERNWDK